MAEYTTLSALFKGIADSIRAKKGSSGAIVANNFPSEINSIVTSGAKPEQAKTVSITQNGDFTVTPDSGKVLTSVLAKVNVPTGPVLGIPMEYAEYTTVEATSGTGYFLKNNEFVKQHRLEKGFFALAIPNVMPGVGFIQFNFGCNFVISQTDASRRGITVSASSATNTMVRVQTGAISGTPEGYNGCLITNSRGDIFCYTGGFQKVCAGKWLIVMGVLPIA